MRRLVLVISVGLALVPLLGPNNRSASAQLADPDRFDQPFKCPYCGLASFRNITRKAECLRCARASPLVKPVLPPVDLDLPPEDRPGASVPMPLRCPFCGLASPVRITQKSQCPRCSRPTPLPPELAAELGTSVPPGTATDQQEDGGRKRFPRGPGDLLVLVGTSLLVLLAAAYGIARSMGAWPMFTLFSGRTPEEEACICRCPKCNGKTRYPRRRGGQTTKCSRCRWQYLLPQPTE